MTRNSAHAAVLIVAALCLSVVVPAVAAGQSNVTLTVTVVDGNGDTVSGVDIAATWEDGGGPVEGTTHTNGQKLVDVPEGANVTLSVNDSDYVRNEPLEIKDASTRDVEVRVAQSGSATIDVADARGPVGGSEVQMYKDGTLVVTERTGSEGTLQTRVIEQGDYEVRVWRQGYLRNTTELTVDGDVSQEVRIAQDSRLLQVTVRDDHFAPAQPVSDGSVEVEGVGTVSTLSNGEMTIQVPVNSKYDVTVTKDGYETNTTSVKVREEAETANLTIQRTDGINLDVANKRVVAGESVRVTVTDEYGDPVSNADVSVAGESVGQIDDDGVTSIPVDDAGTHNLTATSGDLKATASVEGVQAGGDETTENATATATADGTTTGPSDFSGPGFSLVSAIVALVAVGLLHRRD